MTDWLAGLEVRHADVFGERDWHVHVRDLNRRLGLTDRFAFAESRWAPDFFYGPLPDFAPGQWLAAISLNPKEGSAEDRAWHEAIQWDATSSWRYQTRQDLRGFKPEDFYYRKWAHPFVILESELALRPELLERPMEAFFSSVASFEIIPYASHQYASRTWEALGPDAGCDFAREVAMTVIQECPPVAVVANGLDAVETAAKWLPFRAPLVEHVYPSVSSGRALRHWQGVVSLGGRDVVFAGFPFMRTQSGHNSYAEIGQLGREIRARG